MNAKKPPIRRDEVTTRRPLHRPGPHQEPPNRGPKAPSPSERTPLASGRTCRVIFCFHEEELVALNGFIKKSQKTPQGELELAVSRKGAGPTSKKKRNPRHGSTLDPSLKEEGVLEEFRAAAVKEVIAWQMEKAMKAKKLTKNKVAELMQTSRA